MVYLFIYAVLHVTADYLCDSIGLRILFYFHQQYGGIIKLRYSGIIQSLFGNVIQLLYWGVV